MRFRKQFWFRHCIWTGSGHIVLVFSIGRVMVCASCQMKNGGCQHSKFEKKIRNNYLIFANKWVDDSVFNGNWKKWNMTIHKFTFYCAILGANEFQFSFWPRYWIHIFFIMIIFWLLNIKITVVKSWNEDFIQKYGDLWLR